VDEYGSDFDLEEPTSKETLTLEELIELVETTPNGDPEAGDDGFLVSFWEGQRRSYHEWGGDADPQRWVNFARIESELYPGLARWYEGRAVTWIAERLSEEAGSA